MRETPVVSAPQQHHALPQKLVRGVKKAHTVLSSCLVSAPHYLDSSYLKQLSKQIFFKCYQCKEKVYCLFSEIFSHSITLLSSPVFFKN